MATRREPTRRRRTAPRGTSLAAMGVVTVDADFEQEFPDGSATCTETMATLLRTGLALEQALDRSVEASFGLNLGGISPLAVIDGSPEPLTPSEIAERTLTPSATMTATLDNLERRGWIKRIPNPEDRRSLLIEITDDGREAADQLVPGLHTLEVTMLDVLTEPERRAMLKLLAKVLGRVAELAGEEPVPLAGRRNRPERLQPHR